VGKPRHGKPGLTSPARPGMVQKSRVWAAFFGTMGGPCQQNHSSTADSGQAWVLFSGVFGKAWPESPTARQKTPHLGWAWAEFLGPIVRPGWAQASISCVGLFLGPVRPEKMPRYSRGDGVCVRGVLEGGDRRGCVTHVGLPCASCADVSRCRRCGHMRVCVSRQRTFWSCMRHTVNLKLPVHR
jgi:hypothetical protein